MGLGIIILLLILLTTCIICYYCYTKYHKREIEGMSCDVLYNDRLVGAEGVRAMEYVSTNRLRRWEPSPSSSNVYCSMDMRDIFLNNNSNACDKTSNIFFRSMNVIKDVRRDGTVDNVTMLPIDKCIWEINEEAANDVDNLGTFWKVFQETECEKIAIPYQDSIRSKALSLDTCMTSNNKLEHDNPLLRYELGELTRELGIVKEEYVFEEELYVTCEEEYKECKETVERLRTSINDYNAFQITCDSNRSDCLYKNEMLMKEYNLCNIEYHTFQSTYNELVNDYTNNTSNNIGLSNIYYGMLRDLTECVTAKDTTCNLYLECMARQRQLANTLSNLSRDSALCTANRRASEVDVSDLNISITYLEGILGELGERGVRLQDASRTISLEKNDLERQTKTDSASSCGVFGKMTDLPQKVGEAVGTINEYINNVNDIVPAKMLPISECPNDCTCVECGPCPPCFRCSGPSGPLTTWGVSAPGWYGPPTYTDPRDSSKQIPIGFVMTWPNDYGLSTVESVGLEGGGGGKYFTILQPGKTTSSNAWWLATTNPRNRIFMAGNLGFGNLTDDLPGAFGLQGNIDYRKSYNRDATRQICKLDNAGIEYVNKYGKFTSRHDER